MFSHPRPSRLSWSVLLLVFAASVIGMAAGGGTGGDAGSKADAGVQALVGAQLIDPSANGKTVDNAVVVIRDGKIERVGSASSVRPPAEARVTSLTGKFLLPGLGMMADAGLTPAQILRASTIDAARAMKLETTNGVLIPGAWADLAAYDRSPLQDIANTKSLSGVWIAGNSITR
jgi:imidazolonepropionase-like amidohydrolase